MNTLIRLEGLHKGYAGAKVLRGISLEVAAGQIVAIMGPSGCGKSTLLHILGLLLTPDLGRYEVLGQEMFALNHREKARFRRQFFGFILRKDGYRTPGGRNIIRFESDQLINFSWLYNFQWFCPGRHYSTHVWYFRLSYTFSATCYKRETDC